MQLFQFLKQTQKTEIKEQLPDPKPIVYSFQTAGTEFPILTRRLETEPWLSLDMLADDQHPISYGLASLTGSRANNQDTALVFRSEAERVGDLIPICFIVVADGMGGHWGGEYASSIAAEMLAECVISKIILPQHIGGETRYGPQIIRDVLADAMQSAHELVQFNVSGGGTTATCALVIGEEIMVAHIGDSRAYLISDGELELLTRDHLLVRRLEETGAISRGEAERHPYRNILYRAIGIDEDFNVDITERRFQPSSLALLCTDGVWGVLSDQHMLQIIMDSHDPQEACDRLVNAAIEANGSDNVTAVLMHLAD